MFNARGDGVPCCPWVRRPKSIFLTHEQYIYLVDSYKCGVITMHTMYKWYELSFSSQMPDWFITQLAVGNHHGIWSELTAKLKSLSAEHSLVLPDHVRGETVIDAVTRGVVYNKDVCGRVKTKAGSDERDIYNEFVGGALCYSDVQHVVRQSLAKKTLSWRSRMILRVWWPGTSVELCKRQKIHVDVALEYASRYSNWARLSELVHELVKRPFLGSQFVSNILMYVSLCPIGGTVMRHMLRSRVLDYGLEHAIECFKALHVVVRRSGVPSCPPLWPGTLENCGEGASHIMYLQNLVGRFWFRNLSAGDDVAQRAVHGRAQRVYCGAARGWSASYCEEVIGREVDKVSALFEHGVSQERGWTAELFHANMMMFATGGSTSAAPRQDLEYTVNGIPHKSPAGRSKLLWVNSLATSDISKMLLRNTPKLRGTAVDKYESGKLRMLLPGPACQWLIESAALLVGEGYVYRHSDDLVLNKDATVELAMMTRRLADTCGEHVAICSDFKDHNILHTFKNMKRQWLSMAQKLDPRIGTFAADWDSLSYRAFAASACRWAAASLADVAARASGVDDYVELVRGLWSGWRSTTFINTTFNRYYQEAVSCSFRNAYGYDALVYKHLLGDDMAGACRDEWTGLRYLELIDYSGFDAQAAKQMISTTHSEFLRCAYRGGSVIVGSLARSIAGFTSSDGQTAPAGYGYEAAKAMVSNLFVLRRRGATVPKAGARWLCATIGAVRSHGKLVKPPRTVLDATVSSGGFGLGDHPVELTVSREQHPARMRVLASQIMRNGSKAAAAIAQRMMHRWAIRLPIEYTLDHAGVTMAGSLPGPLAAHHRVRANEATALFYSTATETRELALPDELNDVWWEQTFVPYAQRRLRQLQHSIHYAQPVPRGMGDLDVAVAAALGPLAPVTGAKSLLKLPGLDRCAAAARMGGQVATQLVAKVVAQFGRNACNEYIAGTISNPSYTFRDVAPSHTVLFDHVMMGALGLARNCLIDNSKFLNNFYVKAGSIFERLVGIDQYWCGQQQY